MTTTITRDALTDAGVVDVLVVGGGITGAAIAHEAASRGLSVHLVERGDFGAATSAATGKLIHGGLRYLRNLEVGLVRESLAERRILSTIAPGLVSPIGMVLPDPGLVEKLGLTVYDLLSFDRNRVAASHRIPAHRSLSADDLDDRGLGHLRRGILFHDAMMLSPERLTLAFVRSAVAAGARVANYVRADELLVRRGQVVGAAVTDLVSGASTHVRARVTVNASGPWARDLLAAQAGTKRAAGDAPPVRSEGIYLVTRPLTETMVLTVSSGSHFSFAPWRGRTLIGPTETPYTGEVDEWRLTRASIERFVADINATSKMPVRLSMDDVLAAYGGLRPLTESGTGSGTDTYRASRSSELVDHTREGARGLVTATGGKYTTARAFAQRVVSHLGRTLGTRIAPSRTAHSPLDASAPVDASTSTLLDRLYGTDAAAVRAIAAEGGRLAASATDDGEVLAQVAFAARHEAVVHLTDILLNRTGIGRRGDPGTHVLTAAADIAAAELDWSSIRRAAELDAAIAAVRLPD
ncbi:glycerol-3-phosphate dehydrogenase/oxidase [Microbacterium dauci]|uniref:FAD-dependent oxidoreductase n=1 Tax=Microbacterium dauci TaxID=3048008 RepID=A0ABT6ZAH8_9MICO|nr:FAD-dependent oxidoreductase [Microbacterium sp. LX3-4]MDJ1113168.1 FAD-dependent oxidoreductase [Microbacterium sp. LX3-4]